jgi:membrane protein
MKRLVWLGKRLVKEIGEDDLSGASAELAYRFFLALFPFFIFLAALGGFVASAFDIANPTDEVMNRLGDSLPEDASSVLRTQLESVIEQRNTGLASIAIVGAIWAASSGIGSLMKAMNRIFEVKETRPLWLKYGTAVGLTVLGAGLLVTSFTLFFVLQVYGTRIADELGLSSAGNVGLTVAGYVLPVIGVMIAVAILYWQAPNTNYPIRWISPGAVVFTVSWLVGSFLFGLYVANFGSYNATYGALAGVVILLIWFYLTGFLLLLGAEINVILTQAYEPEVHDAQPQATEPAVTPDGTERAPANQGAGLAASARQQGNKGAAQYPAQANAFVPSNDGHQSTVARMDTPKPAQRRVRNPLAAGLTGLLWLFAIAAVARRGSRQDREAEG